MIHGAGRAGQQQKPHLTPSPSMFRFLTMAGIAESIVLYCARHRFSTDAMEDTGNRMAVMDAMGHSKMDVTRFYQHPGNEADPGSD